MQRSVVRETNMVHIKFLNSSKTEGIKYEKASPF